MATGSNAILQDSIVARQLVVEKTEKTAGRTGRNAYFSSLTDVKLGGWFNAAKAQLHFGSAGTGEITGLASAFNSEIYLPNKTMAGGSYCIYEGNMNFQASTVVHSSAAIPLCLMSFNLGGTQAGIDAWEASAGAGLFSINGLTAANDEVFDTQGGATNTGCLRILIDGTAYWIMLATDPGA